MKYKSTAYLEDGLLKLRNSKEATKFCQSLNCAEFTVTFEKKKAIRSLEQNAYYWSAVVPLMRQGFEDLGNTFTLESAHEFIKSEFNFKEIINEKTGEIKRVPQSTTTLSKSEFCELIDRLNVFCGEWFGFNIPAPGIQVELELH